MTCKELLAELPASDPERHFLEDFFMCVYCFPKPSDPKQAKMIRALGFVENVVRDIRWESPDYIKIDNVRREAF